MSCFNPLHCGAVVASDRASDAFDVFALEFQSPSLRGSGRFISGSDGSGGNTLFQSPSLRGSGRFGLLAVFGSGFFLLFQSPSLRGSGRFALPPFQ